MSQARAYADLAERVCWDSQAHRAAHLVRLGGLLLGFLEARECVHAALVNDAPQDVREEAFSRRRSAWFALRSQAKATRQAWSDLAQRDAERGDPS